MKRSIFLLATFCLFASTLAAPPDVAGKWKWLYDRDGESPLDISMDLKQEESRLTGKISAPEGRQLEIRDGKVSDDGVVSFYITFPRDSGDLKIEFKGKAAGDAIQGTSGYTNDDGDRRERAWNPKREQDVTGKWASTIRRSDGTPMETTLTLKQSGEKLSGTHAFREFETEIQDGRLVGDEVNFRIVREWEGRTITSKYTGKLQKDRSIKGTVESDWTGEVRRLEWEARKAK
jgi:hypothetical protein